ncbi:MAG: hypothetical protein WBA23_13485 [Tunicatimonas sp.]|uniref:hypothetical protein n=1 Tax=Tunicatimonas sp. TaxID=1940096 RepID=UPI003C706F75
MNKVLIITAYLFIFFAQPTWAQDGNSSLDTRINLLLGLNQPVFADGFNIEGNIFYKRFVFDYSHGVSLDFSGNTVSGELAEQQLKVHMPYTTGFGLGYRFNSWFNLRLEPKWHRFEISYDSDMPLEVNEEIVSYNTFSLGIGAYANWRPFANKSGAINGLMVVPSIRYWPRVSSSLAGNEFTYDNRLTGQTETHEAMQAGINNTPFIFNVSIGYSLPIKK